LTSVAGKTLLFLRGPPGPLTGKKKVNQLRARKLGGECAPEREGKLYAYFPWGRASPFLTKKKTWEGGKGKGGLRALIRKKALQPFVKRTRGKGEVG